MIVRSTVVGFGALLVACSGSSTTAPSATSSQLPVGVAARAGGDVVSSETVRRIAAAQGLAPPQALERAISDALLAEAARRSTPSGIPSHIERAALARSLLEQLARDAARRGPPTAAELDEIARARWLEIDRPDAVRTTHAVVLVKDEQLETTGRRVAEKLVEAVKAATTADEFSRLAKEVPLEGLELKVEPLSAVTPDGRTFELREGTLVARGTFDPAFAQAANALTTIGQLSPITRTKFGFHVIRLEERVAGNVVPKSELPTLLGPEVLTRRAARGKAELLEQLRRDAVVERDRGVDELTKRAKVAP